MESGDRQQEFSAELAAFEACLEHSRTAPLEEAVPAEMMQVFSDDQWPELLFEFQPSLQIFTARRDVVGWYRTRDRDAQSAPPERGKERAWLVFRQVDEQLIRPLEELERSALTLAQSGVNFAGLALQLWPRLDTAAAHHNMTELLLRWLDEGLVIDAGVPVPEDAEYAD